MLAVAPLRDTRDEKQREMEGFDCGALSGRNNDIMDDESFDHFSADGNLLLESIDFDDLFVGINEGDVMPDLEMDTDILADFSVVSPGISGEESVSNGQVEDYNYYCPISKDEEELDKISGSGSGSGSGLDSSLSTRGGEEIVSKRDEEVNIPALSRSKLDGEKGKKSSHASSSQAKHNQGKRKVDWTPELHRRFVQAVEQLGVDKAVPSRILELMGIDCLTRHNIASHLQKYRSHRKHLLAREAEAASWSQRRQMYGGGAVAAAVVGGGTGGGKRSDVLMSQWHAPTMGFPPVPPMHHFRPLHVWGNPSMENSVMHMWPKHLLSHPPSATPPPPTPWLAPLPVPPPDPSYWHHHHHNQRVRNAVTPAAAACFPQPVLPQARFRTTTATSTPPVPGIPPPSQPMYKVDPSAAAAIVPTTGQPAGPHPLFDLQPSKESIDAAIGDVISKPWLPLPLGLKPPSTDGVLVELQRQGIPKIPPACAS